MVSEFRFRGIEYMANKGPMIALRHIFLWVALALCIGCQDTPPPPVGLRPHLAHPRTIPDKWLHTIDLPLIRIEKTPHGLTYSYYEAGKTSATTPAQIVALLALIEEDKRSPVRITIPRDATATEVTALVEDILKPARISSVIYEELFYDIP